MPAARRMTLRCTILAAAVLGACDIPKDGTAAIFASIDGGEAGPDGCSANVDTDPTNCGSCGHVCPVPTNASASCASGVCGTQCTPGFADCDGQPANGCERLVTTDPVNCGACGRDCGGSACQKGLCQPITLATSQPMPFGIAVDATSVYWTVQGATPAAGQLMRANLDGTQPKLLATALATPTVVAVDLTSVFWVSRGTPPGFFDGGLFRVGKDGTGQVNLAIGQVNPMGLTLDATNAYVTSAGSATSATGAVLRMAKDASNYSYLAVSQPAPFGVALDTSGLFWTAQGTQPNGFADGALVGAQVDGGAPAPIYTSADQPAGMAIDATNLFVASRRDGAIRRVPRAGGSAAALVTGEKSPEYLVTDDTAIYFTTGTPGQTDGALKAIGKDGKCPPGPCPRVLATGQATPKTVAVDARFVYWIEQATGSVLKVAK